MFGNLHAQFPALDQTIYFGGGVLGKGDGDHRL
jgi:hypothetical protein